MHLSLRPTLLLAVAALPFLAGCAPHPPRLPNRHATPLENHLDDWSDLALSNVRSRKLAIFTAELRLGQEQANVFWPHWRAYESALAVIEDDINTAQVEYARNRSLDGTTADALAKRILDGETARNRLLADTYARFASDIGNRQALRWMAIERQLRTASDLRANAETPLAPIISEPTVTPVQ